MFNLPSMPSMPTIPTGQQLAQGVLDQSNKFVTDQLDALTSTPDFGRFATIVNGNELAQNNLYTITFPSFDWEASGDGIINFQDPINVLGSDGRVDAMSALGAAGSYAWSRGKDLITSEIMRTAAPKLKAIMGAYDPTLISDIPVIGGIFDSIFGVGYDLNKDMGLFAAGVSIPSESLETQLNYSHRTPFVQVTGQTHGTFSVTMYCTNGAPERAFFLAWMKMVYDPSTRRSGFADVYSRNIMVSMINRRGVRESVIRLKRCFPIGVGELNMSWQGNAEITTCTITFAYESQQHVISKGQENIFDKVESILNRSKAARGALGV